MSEVESAEIRILVADDDAAVRSGTVHVLQKAGYACAAAANGVQALQLLPSFRPNLVLLDRDMPEMDGVELCRRLKAAPEYAGVFVVLISGVYTLNEEQSTGLEAGADGYIARPITNRELLVRLAAFTRILHLNLALREKTQMHLQGQEALLRAQAELERRVAARADALRPAD